MTSTYFDEEGPTEHDAHLLDHEWDNDLVPCPVCGKTILALADRCHKCGSVFDQEAWLVQPSANKSVYVLIAIGLALVIGFAVLMQM